jgi:UDP-N-acetylglucosamine--N-acetylmuramyl-(pentapeptide) pyrophosphoryl-undecaprenol N-acetylglucosamine transferase
LPVNKKFVKQKLKILMSGGGSGGHVFPAIAIAEAIQKIAPNTEFLFIGAEGKIEMTAVPKAGFNIKGLPIAGFHRKLTLQNALFPFKLIISIIKAWFYVKQFKPNVAIGTGGYASGAALKAAQWQGVPTFVQEQNAFPGVTNKLLANKVKKVFAAYPGLEKYFPKDKIEITGNPLRASVSIQNIDKAAALNHFKLNPQYPVIFITGGSLGASVINKAIKDKLALFQEQNIQLIWQCGKIYENEYFPLATEQVKVFSFIDRMDLAYAAADIIISRAGGTISELALVGKPTILLPSPNVAEDHQTKNVMALVEKDAAILIKDVNAVELLVPSAIHLLSDENKKERLSQQIRLFAKPNAAQDIAQTILNSLS